MSTLQSGGSGIGDLKELTYVRHGCAREAVPVVTDRSRRRKLLALIAAMLLIAGAQYVALKIIYATQPVHVTRGK